MRPTECPPADWGLYYNNCYMRHLERGLVFVRLDGGAFRANQGNPDTSFLCEAEALHPIWPIPAAINYNNSAYYIGRRARREARRSATPHHYSVDWYDRPTFNMSFQMFSQFVDPDSYPTITEALEMLSTDITSVAVTRDLILFKLPACTQIVYRGMSAGTLQADNGQYEYIPNISNSPVARRVQFKLQKEGLLCH